MLADAPRPPLLLGFGGLIPFWAAALGVWLLPGAATVLIYAQIAYGAVIVSHIGAIHWGGAMAAGEAGWGRYGWSVVPALIGWAALVAAPAAGPVPALLLLLLALGLALAFDLRIVAQGRAPAWFGRLRRWLSALAIGALLLTLLRVLGL
ncbi:MAG TPA: DUF3429 domain-containing protein [Alphaproteobacteria bacterium]|nr:DUF3429 domain-containing protein [Alphaproteobacteria bacterium]